MSMEHISTYTEEKSKKLNRGPRFVRFAVLLGIVIVLNVCFMVLRSLVFPEPQYTDFCPASPAPAPTTQQACAMAHGTWTPMPEVSASPTAPTDGVAVAVPTPLQAGYCDTITMCNNAYEKADAQYQVKGFALLLGLGLLAVILGVLPLGSSIVSSGLSYGGVVSFVIASLQYWGSADNWVRLIISVIALAVLMYIGLKRFRD